MDLIAGQALREFRAVQKQGLLPAAVPYLDVRTNSIGLCAAGIPVDTDGIISELAFSEDREDRAAAAIMACTNVARATEQADPFCVCVHMTARKPKMSVFVTHSCEDHQRLATLAHEISHVVFWRLAPGADHLT